MSDYVKKFFLAGIGLTRTIVEKAEKQVDDLVKKGEQAEDRYSRMAKDLLSSAENNLIDFKNYLNPFNKSKEKEKDARIERLSKELEQLKKEVNKLKRAGLD